MRRVTCAGLLLCLLSISSIASAQTAPPELAVVGVPHGLQATIVQTDGEDVVIDLGSAAIGDARAFTVYRALEVRHPVSAAIVRDRFVIGSLSISQTGATLSVTRVVGSPTRAFQVGDIVEVTGEPAVAPIAPTLVTQAADPASATDEREVVRYWEATLTKPPEMRIRYYEEFLVKYPNSSYRDFVQAEIANLSQVVAAAVDATAQRAAQVEIANTIVTLRSPRRADEGWSVQIVAHLITPASVRSLTLHARPLERPGFDQFVMHIDDRGYARATVPASIVRLPGFAFFVAGVDAEGAVVAAHASEESPSIVTVKPTHRRPDPEPNEPTPAVHHHWYGWQNLLVDVAALAVAIVSVNADASALASVGIYLLGGPIVHCAHGQRGRGFGSLGLRFAMPIVGLLGCGVFADGDDSACSLEGIILGGAVGMLGAIIIDAAVLAHEDVPNEVSAAPRVSIAIDQRSAGLVASGNF